MFAYGMIAHPRYGSLIARAVIPAHTSVALSTAEASVVLLKNTGPILPLSGRDPSVAVIGVDASSLTQSSGGGSSAVKAPFVVTPLAAIRSALGKHVLVSYTPGSPTSLDLDQLSDTDIVTGTPLPVETPINSTGEPGKADLSIDSASNVSAAVATATHSGTGEGWSHWRVVVRVRHTGTYEVSLQQVGDAWLYLDGHQLLASPGLHARTTWATTVPLRANHRYTLTANWFDVAHRGPPQFGMADVTPQINAAVAAARKSRVAIVFASDFEIEGADRPDLDLPGDANALISAVAAANPHTIVVLNTGGAVLMPWLGQVAAVLEAWYPGEEDGAAVAAVLTGHVDPSGRLPLTFPSSPAALPNSSVDQFPGVNSVVNFGNPLEVGYRWYQAHGVTPLFPFGFGLDYTSFDLSSPSMQATTSSLVVRLTVTNTGLRTGADVVQAYIRFPSSAGEPPEQLRAFSRVVLRPSSSSDVTLVVPKTAFEVFLHRSFETVPGQCGIDIGQSSADLSIHFPVSCAP